MKADIQQCHQKGKEPAKSQSLLFVLHSFHYYTGIPLCRLFTKFLFLCRLSLSDVFTFCIHFAIIFSTRLSISAGYVVRLSCPGWLPVVITPPTSSAILPHSLQNTQMDLILASFSGFSAGFYVTIKTQSWHNPTLISVVSKTWWICWVRERQSKRYTVKERKGKLRR